MEEEEKVVIPLGMESEQQIMDTWDIDGADVGNEHADGHTNECVCVCNVVRKFQNSEGAGNGTKCQFALNPSHHSSTIFFVVKIRKRGGGQKRHEWRKGNNRQQSGSVHTVRSWKNDKAN